MSAAKDRVWSEITDLVTKRSALQAFVGTETYERLSDQQKGYLYTQNLLMEAYEMVLRMRYMAWED